MNTPPFCRRLFALLLAACFALLTSCSAQESDGDILTEISNRMHADHRMEGINASVDQGVVTLTGTCPDEPCRQHAAEVAKDIEGVKEVVNKITVASPPAPPR